MAICTKRSRTATAQKRDKKYLQKSIDKRGETCYNEKATGAAKPPKKIKITEGEKLKYFIDGAEVTREAVKAQLSEELREAETRPTFQGRIFYNIDYIEHVAVRSMKANKKNYFLFFNVRLEKN